MQKIIYFIISFFAVTSINAANIELVGILDQSSSITGYVRDAAFYNDTCYFISGDRHSVVMSTPNGARIYNFLTQMSFGRAMRIYVNDIHVIIQDDKVIKIYKKSGQLVRQIALPLLVNTSYFWIRNKTEIMAATSNQLLVYDYNTGNILANKVINGIFASYSFANDGQQLFYSEGERLIKYSYSNNTINEYDITTPRIFEMANDTSRYYYFACCGANKSLWFDYYKRDSVFVMNSDFSSMIDKYQIFQNVVPPSGEQLELESGNPHMKIYYDQKNSILQVYFCLYA